MKQLFEVNYLNISLSIPINRSLSSSVRHIPVLVFVSEIRNTRY